MSLIIAWEGRIESARVRSAVVDGVVPIVIVISRCSVPPAVVRLKRIMRPANPSVSAGYYNVLSSETQCPYLWRVHVINAGLDRRGTLE